MLHLVRAMMIDPKIVGYNHQLLTLPELRQEVEKLILQNRGDWITQIVITTICKVRTTHADCHYQLK